MIKRGDLKYQHYRRGHPRVLFDLRADPAERESGRGRRHRSAMADFRRRLAELGYGPEAKSGYVNAGYDPGVPVAEAGPGTLWRPEIRTRGSIPWS